MIHPSCTLDKVGICQEWGTMVFVVMPRSSAVCLLLALCVSDGLTECRQDVIPAEGAEDECTPHRA